MIDRTVGELVAERPGRSRILQRHGIDFCCQGARTLDEACDGSRVAVEAVLGEFAAEVAQPAAKVPNPAALPLHELCAYIVETHHGYLRRELPRFAHHGATGGRRAWPAHTIVDRSFQRLYGPG